MTACVRAHTERSLRAPACAISPPSAPPLTCAVCVCVYCSAASANILNRVARDWLPHVLTHILDKLTAKVCAANAAHDKRKGATRTNSVCVCAAAAARQTAEVFSAQETQQLQEMLSFSQDDIDAMVALVRDVFLDAARFGKVDRCALLTVDADVVAILERAWRKKGKALVGSEPFADGSHAMDVAKLPVLRATKWQLHLEMGQSKHRGHTTPTALFQLELAAAAADTAGRQRDEKVNLEMNHDELRAFFHQLNAIQAHLDHHHALAGH